MTTINATEARENFSETIDRVAHGGERLVIVRNRKARVALVSIEDLELLEQLEDVIDLAAAREALKDKRRIPLAAVKKKLGL